METTEYGNNMGSGNNKLSNEGNSSLKNMETVKETAMRNSTIRKQYQ